MAKRSLNSSQRRLLVTKGRRHRILAGVAALFAVGAVPNVVVGAPHATSTAPKTVWLCRPGVRVDPCATSLATTVVSSTGTTTVGNPTRGPAPPIDCFYVYPTVSTQSTVNADLHIDPEEIAIAQIQAARFSSVCRVYAPMYRQLTLAAVNGPLGGVSPQTERIAYDGVLAAWRDYLAHDNHGRGVVFIGHSQGAVLLRELLRSQIDRSPTLRRRMVSAILVGANVLVRRGGDIGGDFRHLAACRAAPQTHCIIAYSSFDHTPPAASLIVRPVGGISLLSKPPDIANLQVLCVDPAALSGGSGRLDSYFRTTPFPGPSGSVWTPVPTASTPWVEYPDLYTASCQHADDATWLQITASAIAGDPRPRVSDTIGPQLGLHLWDVSLAAGNLVGIVRQQSRAWQERRGSG